MKTILRILLVLVPVLAFAAPPPPILRNPFSTNAPGTDVLGTLNFNGELYSAQGFIAPYLTISNSLAGDPGIYPISGNGSLTFDSSGVLIIWDSPDTWEFDTNSTLSPVTHTTLTNWTHARLQASHLKLATFTTANRLFITTTSGFVTNADVQSPYLQLSGGVLSLPVFGSGTAGQVWTSEGSTATWSNLPPAVYGGMYTDDAGVSVVVTNAGTYYPFLGFFASVSNHVAVVTNGTFAAPDRLVVGTAGAGTFFCSMNISASGTANATIHVAAFTNNVKAANVSVERKLGGTGDVGAASSSGLMYLPAGATVSLRMTSDGNGDTYTINHATLNIHRINP